MGYQNERICIRVVSSGKLAGRRGNELSCFGLFSVYSHWIRYIHLESMNT